MPPLTNLTELFWDSEKTDALLLTAKPTTGADYTVFRHLCEAFSMMPAHPIRLYAEDQLQELFGIDLPMTPEHCDAIWKQTAERLLLCPLTRKAAEAVERKERRLLEPLTLSNAEHYGFSDFPSLPAIETEDYAAWETAQAEWLQKQKMVSGVSLILPSGFRMVKPNRYHAERHLAKIETNENLWTSQIFRFLAYVLQKSEKKILLQTACKPSEIVTLLAETAEKIELPSIVWLPEKTTDAEFLIDLCRAYPKPDVSFAVRADARIETADLATHVPLGRVCIFS